MTVIDASTIRAQADMLRIFREQHAERFLRLPEGQAGILQSRFLGGRFLGCPKHVETAAHAALEALLRIVQVCAGVLERAILPLPARYSPLIKLRTRFSSILLAGFTCVSLA